MLQNLQKKYVNKPCHRLLTKFRRKHSLNENLVFKNSRMQGKEISDTYHTNFTSTKKTQKEKRTLSKNQTAENL